jgi:hypothetical protein
MAEPRGLGPTPRLRQQVSWASSRSRQSAGSSKSSIETPPPARHAGRFSRAGSRGSTTSTTSTSGGPPPRPERRLSWPRDPGTPHHLRATRAVLRRALLEGPTALPAARAFCPCPRHSASDRRTEQDTRRVVRRLRDFPEDGIGVAAPLIARRRSAAPYARRAVVVRARTGTLADRPFRSSDARLARRPQPGESSSAGSLALPLYCRAMAIRRRSSGVIRWSTSSAASSMSSWTQRTRPVNLLPRGP